MMIIFLGVLSIQLLYMIVYTVAIGGYKPKTNTDKKMSPISVIVCAHNELSNLHILIPKLLSQSHEDFEIIIVNDQSTDGTYEYLIELKKECHQLKTVQIDHTPDHFSRKKYGITLGVKAAKNDSIAFIDADCYPNSDDWLKSLSNEYDDNTEIVLGASLYEKKKGFLNQFIRYETYWTAIQYIGCGLIGTPYMGVGRNLSYSKSLFLKNKGFNKHQQVVGGDDDLFVNEYATKKNTSIAIGNSALTYSYPKTTFESFFRQKMRHLSVGKHYKLKHQIILGIYTLSYLLFWSLSIGLIFAYPLVIGVGLIIRMSVIYLMYYVCSKRVGEVYLPLVLPILDIVYGFYYIATAVLAVFSKKVKWR